MKTLIFASLLLCATGALAAAVGAERPAAVDSGRLGAVDAIVRKGIADHVYPGAVLVIGQPGKTLFARAYGNLAYETTSPAMRLDTIFDLASVSKVVGTATAAMLLLEDKAIGLNDLVSSHVAGFGQNGKQVSTLKDLLTHVSGLPAYANRDKIEKTRRPDESHADAAIRYYADLKAAYTPETTLTYSCLNMQTMARVNENVSGRRQEDLLKERVYGPLGMKDTRYILSPEQRKRVAPTLLKKDGTWLVGEVHDPLANYYGSTGHCPGNAGLYSTAPDLARFCEMILRGGRAGSKQVLRPETVKLMTSQQVPAAVRDTRGLGWDIFSDFPYATPLNQADGVRTIGHTGYTGTLIWLDQKTKTYVVFLTNRTFPDDAEKPKGSPTILAVRKQVLATVLGALEPYRAVADAATSGSTRRLRGRR